MQNSKTHAALESCFPAIILSEASGENIFFLNLLLLNDKKLELETLRTKL